MELVNSDSYLLLVATSYRNITSISNTLVDSCLDQAEEILVTPQGRYRRRNRRDYGTCQISCSHNQCKAQIELTEVKLHAASPKAAFMVTILSKLIPNIVGYISYKLRAMINIIHFVIFHREKI